MSLLKGNEKIWKRTFEHGVILLLLCIVPSFFQEVSAQISSIKKIYEYTATPVRNMHDPPIINLKKQQPQDPISKNFKIEDGMISNETHDVLSDSRGFIWIAADGGICRYDGTKFVRFSISEGLPERMVTKLHEDKKGRIWFITISSYVGYIQDDQVTMLKYKFKEGAARFQMDDYAHSLYVDEGDTLWVSTIYSGMVYKSAYPYTAEPVARKIESDFVIEFNKKGDYIYGTYMIPCRQNQMVSCNIDVCLRYEQKWKNKTRYFTANVDFEIWYRIHKIVKASPDEFFLCDKYGMYSFRKGKFKRELDISVVTAKVDEQGKLWVFATNQGLYVFDSYKKLDKWKYYYKEQYFTGMARDIEGGTWLTTLYDGVKYVPDFKFLTLLKEGKQLEHIISYRDKVLVNEKLGDLFIFDKHNSVNRYDLELYYVSPYIDEGSVSFYVMNAVGLHSVSGMNDKKKVKEEKREGYNVTIHVKKILRYKGDDYLMNMSFLYCYQSRNKKTVPVCVAKSRINNLVIIRDTAWMATNNGLFSFDLVRKKWIENPFTAKHLNFRIDDIEASEDGLWLCSFGKGVMHYDKKNKLKLYDVKKGLTSNYIRDIYLGPQNNLWVSTNEGLSRISAKGRVINYSYLEGYGIGQINDMLRIEDNLYVATSNGFYKFPISRLDKQNKVSPVYITGASSKYIPKLSNNVELEYGDDKITINFLALNYTNARKAEYYYMIKGFDDQWHKSTTSSVKLNKLPPGTYHFIVKTNSNRYATFDFSIKYPFWQKWWFICLLGSLLVFFVYIVVNQRTRKIKAEEREKNYIQVQIAGLQANVIRAQMNPHFMFNALNSIQSFILANENKQANFYLGKFSSLMRKIIQISRHDFVTVKEELRLLQDYIEIERMRCGYSFRYDIDISNKESLGVRIPAMIIQPFIENAINHGLTPLESREGILEINFDISGKNIICTITDNGIGRIKANEIKQKKIRYHQSASIKLTENRIDLYNKLYKAESKISITDLYDEQQQPAGTQVELIIPIIQ